MESIVLPITEDGPGRWCRSFCPARRLLTLFMMLAKLLREIDAIDQNAQPNYARRNALTYQCVGLALEAGMKAGMRLDTTQKEPERWPVLFIELPTGEVSWHVANEPQAYTPYSAEVKSRRIRLYCYVPVDGIAD